MKLLRNCISTFQKTCTKIHLIDKCLILIMFLLLFQSAYSLFFEVSSSTETNTIDVIIRTATASIFGYFLSSNFIRQPRNDSFKKIGGADTTVSDSKGPIGFKNEMLTSGPDSEKEKPLESGKISITPEETTPYTDNHLQVIITTALAVFCLLILIIIRNIHGSGGGDFTASAQATISQFRDLVSGCIGFLIGVPTTKK